MLSHSLSRVTGAFSTPNQHISLPVHFSHQVVASQMSLSPDKYFGPVRFPFIFRVLTATSTFHASILVGFSTPLRLMFHFISFLIHENPLPFRLRHELFTVLLPNSESSLRTARPHTPLLALLNCFRSRFRHESLVQYGTCLCQLIRFLIAIRDKLLKMRHIFLILFCAVRLDMLHFQQKFLPQKMQVIPNFDPPVRASPAFGSMHFLSPLRRHAL